MIPTTPCTACDGHACVSHLAVPLCLPCWAHIATHRLQQPLRYARVTGRPVPPQNRRHYADTLDRAAGPTSPPPITPREPLPPPPGTRHTRGLS
jgi:hypothetical protein